MSRVRKVRVACSCDFCQRRPFTSSLTVDSSSGDGSLEQLGRAAIPEDDPVSALAAEVMEEDSLVVVLSAHRSSLIRLWRGADLSPAAAFKAHHTAPVAHLALGPRSGVLYSAASGSDFTVRAWDLNAQACLRVVRGLRARPTCLRPFSAAGQDVEMFAVGSVEGHLSVGSVGRGGATHEPTSLVHHGHHKSPVADICVSPTLLVSLGKDNVLAAYKISSSGIDFVRVVPIFEEAASAAFVRTRFLLDKESDEDEDMETEGDDEDKSLAVLTSGAGGTLGLWDVLANRKLKMREELSSLTLPGVAVGGVRVEGKSVLAVQEDVISSLQLKAKRRRRKSGGKKAAAAPVAVSLNFNQVTDADLVCGRYLVVAQGSR